MKLKLPDGYEKYKDAYELGFEAGRDMGYKEGWEECDKSQLRTKEIHESRKSAVVGGQKAVIGGKLEVTTCTNKPNIYDDSISSKEKVDNLKFELSQNALQCVDYLTIQSKQFFCDQIIEGILEFTDKDDSSNGSAIYSFLVFERMLENRNRDEIAEEIRKRIEISRRTH